MIRWNWSTAHQNHINLRTSRKQFEKQLSHIERRQARIRRIRQKLNDNGKIQNILTPEKSLDSPNTSYHIGKTQNHPVDLRTITRQAEDDFAAKVTFHKCLKIYQILIAIDFDRILQKKNESTPVT